MKARASSRIGSVVPPPLPMFLLLAAATAAASFCCCWTTTTTRTGVVVSSFSPVPSTTTAAARRRRLAVGVVPTARTPFPRSVVASTLSTASSRARGPTVAVLPRHLHRLSRAAATTGSRSSSPTMTTTALRLMTDDTSIQETALHRFRRRKTKILKRRKATATGYLFALWYVLCVVYNLFAKRVLNLAPDLAWTTAWFQMTGGLSYVLPLWWMNARPTPSLSGKDQRRLLPVAFLHSLVHIGGVVSMGAGAVSFTYIVKASEPAVSAALAALTGSFLYWTVYLALFPVIAGVAMVSVSELTFTWKSFNYAMMSNLASSSRAIVGKKRINQRLGQNMTPMNLYAVLTIMSSILILPLALIMEGPAMLPAFRQLIATKKLASWIVLNFFAAIFYYTYNEVAFLCLDNVSPVSHAIANVIKRVFIIVSSMLVFGNKMTGQGIIGSVLAVGGVLVYSLEKNRHKKRAELRHRQEQQERKALRRDMEDDNDEEEEEEE